MSHSLVVFWIIPGQVSSPNVAAEWHQFSLDSLAQSLVPTLTASAAPAAIAAQTQVSLFLALACVGCSSLRGPTHSSITLEFLHCAAFSILCRIWQALADDRLVYKECRLLRRGAADIVRVHASVLNHAVSEVNISVIKDGAL